MYASYIFHLLYLFSLHISLAVSVCFYPSKKPLHHSFFTYLFFLPFYSNDERREKETEKKEENTLKEFTREIKMLSFFGSLLRIAVSLNFYPFSSLLTDSS